MWLGLSAYGGTTGTDFDVEDASVVLVSFVDVFSFVSVKSRAVYVHKAGWGSPVEVWEAKRERTALIWRWTDEHSLCFLDDKHLGRKERQLLLLD